MKSVLVSFCNLSAAKSTGILKVDLPSESFHPISLGCFSSVTSCTGLAIEGEKVYLLVVSGGMHYLVGFRQSDFKPAFCQSLDEIKDGHSILTKNGYCYIVSTGTDEVIRYDLVPRGLINPQVVWQASSTKTDTHHINSIIDWRGNLVISAFGPKSEALWASASDGYIHDITRDICIKTGIHHPHSLSVQGRQLYYCESHRKLFCSLEGPIFQLRGYARGVCWLSDDLICMGTSVGRTFSKSTGMIANPADPGEPTGTCAISIRRITTGRTIKYVDLGWFGPEVYDLLALSTPSLLSRLASSWHGAGGFLRRNDNDHSL